MYNASRFTESLECVDVYKPIRSCGGEKYGTKVPGVVEIKTQPCETRGG